MGRMKKKEPARKNIVPKPIVEEKHRFIGPEKLNDWLEWSKNITLEVKRGIIKEEYHKEPPKDIPYETILTTKPNGKIDTQYKTSTLIKPTNEEEFISMCKDKGLGVSNEETFIKIYWNKNKKLSYKPSKVQRVEIRE